MLLSIVVNIITYLLNLERRNVGDVLCMIICCARDAVDMMEGAEGGSHHGHGHRARRRSRCHVSRCIYLDCRS
jgi:hypothetical protein